MKWIALLPLALIVACSTSGPLSSDRRTVAPIRTIPVDEEAWPKFNWAAFDQDKVISYGDFQYSAYWDVDKILVVTRRDLRDHSVETLRLEKHFLTINPDDRHRNIVLGISPGDGRLHLSWDHHANDLRYTKSRAGLLTDPPASLSPEDFESAQPLTADAPQRVTYPRFLNDNNGRLFMMYRSGGSGNGRTVVAQYDSAKGTWTVSSGYLFGSEGTYVPWDSSESRNAYLNEVLFDRNNRMHVSWTYRETGASWASNHDLHYAYSDDNGRSWKNNDGQQIADLAKNDAIVLDDPGIVVREIPVYSWLMNNCAMVLDSRNQPHLVHYQLPGTYRPKKLAHNPPDEVRAQLKFFHHWREPDGSWRSSGPLELPAGMTITRPDLVVSAKDDVIITWASNRGFRSLVASARKKWKDWELVSLTGPEYTSNNACKHDRWLLRDRGIYSFTADPNGLKEGSSGYAILDFDLTKLTSVLR
ncbi:BNR repeat-containing protein [Flavilitoribacter nigricans]|nr:BNR repeat-containing protein [Flavilitoribacter nigricans]